MDGNQIFALGLGLEAPWKLVDQHLDVSSSPYPLHLTVEPIVVACSPALNAQRHVPLMTIKS